MATIAETATVRMRGGDIPEPDSEAGQVIIGAWKVYRWISARAGREGTPALRDGVAGHVWKGKLDSAFNDLWPAGRSPLMGDLRDEACRAIRNWLLASGNVGVADRGRPGTSTRREGMIEPRIPTWWVRDQFAGAPPGMKLPDLDGDGRPVEPFPAAPPVTAPAGKEAEDPWWCPFTVTGNCQTEGPYTREELGLHIQRTHKFRADGGMYGIFIEQAREIREDRKASGYAPAPVPVRQPDPEPPARSIMEMTSASPPPAPAAPPPAPARAPAPQPSAGSVSAQSRVFAMQVAELEAEKDAALRRVAELEAEVRQLKTDERRARLHQLDIDAIAHRTAALLQSKRGDS